MKRLPKRKAVVLAVLVVGVGFMFYRGVWLLSEKRLREDVYDDRMAAIDRIGAQKLIDSGRDLVQRRNELVANANVRASGKSLMILPPGYPELLPPPILKLRPLRVSVAPDYLSVVLMAGHSRLVLFIPAEGVEDERMSRLGARRRADGLWLLGGPDSS